MKNRHFEAGDRVLLLAPLVSGWRGVGVVTADQKPGETTVAFAKFDPGGIITTARVSWVDLELLPPQDGD